MHLPGSEVKNRKEIARTGNYLMNFTVTGREVL
jgi:hypothetical protein